MVRSLSIDGGHQLDMGLQSTIENKLCQVQVISQMGSISFQIDAVTEAVHVTLKPVHARNDQLEGNYLSNSLPGSEEHSFNSDKRIAREE